MKGVDKLERKLKQFATKEIQAVCRKATRAGAAVIRTEAREIVPVRTGTMKKAIKIKARTRNGTVSAVVGIKREDAFYASFIELGTSKHIEAQHNLEKAVDNKKEQAVEVATQRIASEIRGWK